MLAVVAPLTVGCDRSVAPAQSRSPKFEPIFEPLATEVTTVNSSVDTSFVTSDHFICMAIDVSKLRENESLSEIPWDLLESRFAQSLGESNAKLDKLKRVWWLVDRSAVEGLTSFGKEQPDPNILIFDYLRPFDKDELATANEANRAEFEKIQQLNAEVNLGKPGRKEITAVSLNSRRLALGTPKLVQKIAASNGDSRSSLAEQVRRLEFKDDIEGAFSIDPLRSTIDELTATMARFGGERMKKWQKLPASLQGTNFRISLTGSETLNLKIELDDEDVAKSILEVASTEDDANGAFPGLGGLGGFGGMPFGGGGGQRASRVQDVKTMITPTVIEPGKVVADDIKNNDRFSVVLEGSNVRVSLSRPNGLTEFVKALIVDSKNQFDVASRVQQLSVVADAMKAYQAEYGHLPPNGVVTENATIPEQFNWRIGLLKYIDPEHYAEFDFSKPWDAKENQKAANKVPEAFALKLGEMTTRFQVVGGDFGCYGACIDPNSEAAMVKVELIADKPNYTALVVESSANGAVHWAQPDPPMLNNLESKLGNDNENGVLFVTATFKVKAVGREPGKVQGVLTVNGKENVSRNDMINVTR